MSHPFDLVTFDCYGTLIDWEAGIGGSFAREAARDGHTLTRETILREHARIEPRVQAEEYRSYRDVLARTAVEMARACGWRLDAERASFLPDGLVDWPAFPDTNPALERLAAAGCRLGILSNIDEDLIRGTLRRFTVEFEFVVTAEQARGYKPAPAHFELARRRAGGRRWLHAAQSRFPDIVPAVALGIPCVWVNRKNEAVADAAEATGEVVDMAGLADWVTGS